MAGRKEGDVDSALDAFIARATEAPVDTSAFDAQNREAALRREVDELKQRLADVEARHASRPQPWAKMAVAFVIGCASMFAVGFFMPKDPPRARAPESVVVTPVGPAPQAPPAPPPVAPAPAPAPAVDPPPPPMPEARDEARDEPASDERPPEPAAKAAAAKRTPKRAKPAQPAAQDPKGAETDLYNPF